MTVPTLEDALNMINTQYNDTTPQKFAPADNYNNPEHGTTNGMDYHYDNDPFDDHVKLREDALQNGGPKFAFMNSHYAEGALPQTMGRNSPSGSLTSLDSLDEVPSDQLAVTNPPPPVAGIIVKDKMRSAARRRVTFSDSIEFDDGLTGQLDTAEKESCKAYVKLYNSRVASSNASHSTNNNTKPSIPIVKGPIVAPRVVGTPGNTPIKTGEIPCTVPSSSSGSMVVPRSVYAQLSKPVASLGESTPPASTHTERPQQCVAGMEVTPHSISNDRLRKEESILTDDSLEILQDSLDGDDSGSDNVDGSKSEDRGFKSTTGAPSLTPQETNSDKTIYKQADIDDGHHGDRDNNEGYHYNDYHSNQYNVDYYGNPTTMYHNPFGPRNTSKDTSETLTVAKETHQHPHHGYAEELLLQPAGHYTAGSGSGNQSYINDMNQARVTSDNGQSQKSTETEVVYNSSINTSYYKSWYPGSFFSSKTVFGNDVDPDKQDTTVTKPSSIAYELIDDNQNLQQYPNRERERPKPVSGTTRRNDSRNSDISGRINPHGSTKGETSQIEEQTSNQVRHKTSSPSANKDNRKNKMTAKPPHPSTRHKGVVYSSPLHRKRAVASAAKRTTGKSSPRSTTPRKSPSGKARKNKETTAEKGLEKNIRNQQKVGSGVKKSEVRNTRGQSSSSSDEDDELLQNIQRDMDRISMLNNASPAQEEHQKILNNINLAESPSPSPTKSDFRSVYKKVHKPRLGSAKQRAQMASPNRVQPSKIPVYLGPSGNTNDNGAVNQRWTGTMDESSWTDRQNSRQGSFTRTEKELIHPQTAALKQSIALDKTPTDDEINILWDRVRNCLHHKDTQSVGSDSCVNRVDVRRSRTQEPPYTDYYDNALRESSLARTGRASSIAGLGSMRRYGSHEILRRYGSADNLSHHRQQPLLQQRAQRSRQSTQGKPPTVPRQPFAPMASRQTPTATMSTRGNKKL